MAGETSSTTCPPSDYTQIIMEKKKYVLRQLEMLNEQLTEVDSLFGQDLEIRKINKRAMDCGQKSALESAKKSEDRWGREMDSYIDLWNSED